MEEGEFRLEPWIGNDINPPRPDYKGQLRTRTEEALIVDPAFDSEHHRHEVARVHCFRLADGSMASSGLPDPKELMIGDTNYRGLKRANPRCELCEGGDMIPENERFYGWTYRP
jgi:hypothetical protein